jgi:hypothetical protein
VRQQSLHRRWKHHGLKVMGHATRDLFRLMGELLIRGKIRSLVGRRQRIRYIEDYFSFFLDLGAGRALATGFASSRG